MTDWQPIETAPRDGTHVDLLDDGEVTSDVYWGDVEAIDDPDDPWGYGWLRNGMYALEEGSEPTHWRPATPPTEI